MNATTSTRYISAAATGETWRDICKKVLEDVEILRTDGFRPNIGFLYITDALASDAPSILTLFRSVTGIDHWAGCAAIGVCANGIEYVDVPAISVMVGQVDEKSVRAFHAPAQNIKILREELEPWLNNNDAMLVVAHVDSLEDSRPAQMLEEVDALVGGYMVGGLSSSRTEGVIISKEVTRTGVSGFVFSQDVAVATSLSQGCTPMGPLHEISCIDSHIISYLDGRVPFEVFSEDMKSMAEQRLGYKPGEMLIEKGAQSPQGLMHLLEGEAHIAFPVAGSDMNDYTVRNIMAVDPENGLIASAEPVTDGQKIILVYRDDETVKTELSSTLVALQERVLQERGIFAPKAALYISCIARASVAFGEDDAPGGEMKLIRDILGDIPVTGFYANGEISNNRLYGYTGVLTLFL